MQTSPRYSPLRRLLFPYSGEEPLSRAQGLRVIITWAVFFVCTLGVCTLPVMLVLTAASWQRTLILLLAAFLSGIAIFGTLAWVVVALSNRAARILQRRKATETNSTSGGRYGS